MKLYNLGPFLYLIVMLKLPEKNGPSSQVTNRAEYNFDENFLIFFRKLEKWTKYAKKEKRRPYMRDQSHFSNRSCTINHKMRYFGG